MNTKSTRGRALTRPQTIRLLCGSASLIALAALPSLGGCLNRPIEPLDPRTTSMVVERIVQSRIDKIDILLMIDNSASMGDKQQILAAAVPDLVNRLVNPLCVDDKGVPAPTQPATVAEVCPTGYDREFLPIDDMNIGIVDTSLGGMGSGDCEGAAGHGNDGAHLVARTLAGGAPPGANADGFLAWDRKNARGGITDSTALISDLTEMVKGVGETGCGYEQPLEAVTRFLAVPHPYSKIVTDMSKPTAYPSASPTGEDTELEKERQDFLRPDSLLAVIVLTDENDFSINWLGPQNYAPWDTGTFFRSSSACATDPANHCCFSCGLGGPSDCPADPNCKIPGDPNPQTGQPGAPGVYTSKEDAPNLKESQPKRHYGFDPYFPVARYVNAFSQLTIDPTRADLAVKDPKKAVANPIFSDLSNSGKPVRSPQLVFFAAITGVPYQAVAHDPKDLSQGFNTYDKLKEADFFAQYVGDPDHYVDPKNPIMLERTAKRGVPASEPNGGDRSLDTNAPTDIQYACIFPLATPRNSADDDCSTQHLDSQDNPLCTGGNQQPQIKAKAYPGVRELAVAEGLAGQGIAASICPANVDHQGTADHPDLTYGYRPAIGTIIDRLKSQLGAQCLPRQLSVDKNGDVPCVVLEASHRDGGQGPCSEPGRKPVPREDSGAADAARIDPYGQMLGWNNFCLVTELKGDAADMSSDRAKCQNLPDGRLPTTGLDGWCYVDATTTPPVGNAVLVSKCAPNEKHLVRFVGGGQVQTGATELVSCSADTQ